MKRPTGPFHVLLVEDNPGDADLISEALTESGVPLRVSVVSNGIEALDFFADRGQSVDLILLDLNLPRMDGREVIARLKKDERLLHIPVVVLTSSEAERDVLQAYRLHANCYVAKPVDLHEFFALIGGVCTFWLTLAKLPPRLDAVPGWTEQER